jgi:hypothetical protein
MFKVGDTVISTDVQMAEHYGECEILYFSEDGTYVSTKCKRTNVGFNPAFYINRLRRIVKDDFETTGVE